MQLRVRDIYENFIGYKCISCGREKKTGAVVEYRTHKKKLSNKKVMRIKVLIARGRTSEQIAKKFNLPVFLINDIKRGREYLHVKIKTRAKTKRLRRILNG